MQHIHALQLLAQRHDQSGWQHRAPILSALTLAYGNFQPLKIHIISNLAESGCFPALTSVEFGEYNETYMDDFLISCTGFDDYFKLFTSSAFRSVRTFTLRNPQLLESSVQALRELRSPADLQFKVVKWLSSYI
jgi:hypothetical protein